MSYFSQEQGKVLRPFITGQLVHDLGAGMLLQAHQLLDFGARQVIAIDKEPYVLQAQRDERMVPINCYLSNYTEKVEIVFLGSPTNQYIPGLLDLLEKARIIIYLGKNTDLTACGWPGLFWHFLGREVVAYAPEPANVMVVYGSRASTPRPILGEELAALTAHGLVLSFAEAEALASVCNILVGSEALQDK